jgi:hypothetical protein
MQATLPRLRLIYMIRNPMTRAVSHYVHEWTERRAGSDADAAFRSDTTFVDYGRYGMQIAPFVETYGQDNILLTSLEALTGQPEQEFARITRFLDLPSTAVWRHDLRPQNVSKDRMRRLPFQSLIIDHPVAQALRRTLVPASLRHRIRKARQMETRPKIPADLEQRMKEVFLQDRDRLAAFFPGHPALDLCYPFRDHV